MMKGRVELNLNKKIMLLIGVIICLMVIISLAMQFITSNNTSKKSGGKEGSNIETLEVKTFNPGSEKYAKEVFALAVKDKTDTVAIETLLETMKFDEYVGENTAEISAYEDGDVLSFMITSMVKKEDQEKFDEGVGKYAQQLLALIEGVNKVEWSYKVTSEDAKEQATIISLDATSASEEFGQDIKAYGKTLNDFKRLLSLQ